ncbi:MAG TPA: hypothetical protein VNV41_15380 [Candidatus Acidoferrales bacterium]|jgi:hypothetical protein|nr:hypothetical protein [Candidatus Acidoferrales bacterium]
MITEGAKDFSRAYSGWLGKSVVLLVAIRQCKVPLPCSIVSESVSAVHIRIDTGLEMDLRKELILAVEEYGVASNSQIN